MLMLKPFFKYADFSGRARRSEYWLFQMFQILVYLGILALLISGISGGGAQAMAGSLGSLAFLGVFALACFVPNLAVATRRLHDTGKSIWWLALYLPGILAGASTMRGLAEVGQPDAQTLAHAAQGGTLSILSAVTNLIIMVLMCLPGTRGANRFGPDPKGDGRDIAAIFDAPDDDAETYINRPQTTSKPSPKPSIFDVDPTPAAPAIRAQTPKPSIFDVVPTPAAPAHRPQTTPKPSIYHPAATPSAPGRPTFGKRR